MPQYTFRVLIEPDENNTFHGWVPALPGCHTWGDSLEETRANVHDAIRVYLGSLIQEDLPIPCDPGLEFIETVLESEILSQVS
jgi:predicted RNase H-like HicB family nuclease